jgi:pseudouridine-5'-phosphate glycosidase/pseudouridine kinase
MVKLLTRDAPELQDDAERSFVLARNMSGGGEVGGLYVRLFTPEQVLGPEEVVSVNGAGDTFVGALAVGLARGEKVQGVVGFAMKCAGETLRSGESVSRSLAGMRAEVAKLNMGRT